MAQAAKTVYCLASSKEIANRVVDQLINAGFANKDISLLYPNHDDSKKGGLGTEKNTKFPEGGVAGATTGGVLGGSLGLLVGLGSLSIPGMGPLIAAGPLLAALSGSAVGGGLGLLIGSLVGSGIPEYEAKKYEAGLKTGNILISVQSSTQDDVNRAREIMKKEGASDISSSAEKMA